MINNDIFFISYIMTHILTLLSDITELIENNDIYIFILMIIC
jgi:hypothetical protein